MGVTARKPCAPPKCPETAPECTRAGQTAQKSIPYMQAFVTSHTTTGPNAIERNSSENGTKIKRGNAGDRASPIPQLVIPWCGAQIGRCSKRQTSIEIWLNIMD
ncbi:MAG: hypothetical protein DRP09_08850 [Candidatus Thorarchaeota archaeon]|nr:MAG: hypothetical protein DRP09_08850 [Candidatus Thorarchaeota archaeon]